VLLRLLLRVGRVARVGAPVLLLRRLLLRYMSGGPTPLSLTAAAAAALATAWYCTTMAEAKRQKTDGGAGLTIGTHSGTFQCDEALGVWLLRQLPKWSGAKLVRSRNNDVLDGITAAGGIVIDVGGRYDPAALRFDHHHRGFFETFDGEPGKATKADEATGAFKTKLSATGLVFKHFGEDILRELCPGLDGERLKAVYVKLYEGMIEGIDAMDNGIEIADETRYKEGTHLSARVARLNPRWNAPKVDQAAEDAIFEKASALTGAEFSEQLAGLTESWLPARDEVEKALLARASVHPCAQILCFESGGMPWKEHLYALEREHGISGDSSLVMFVLYQDGSGMWRVQAVTAEGTAFTNRLGLPEAWRGLRDAALCDASGIADCCFCHAAGFIGGNKTKEGAIAMAMAAITGA
jgi:uncharacterized UPF0160 family protein